MKKELAQSKQIKVKDSGDFSVEEICDFLLFNIEKKDHNKIKIWVKKAEILGILSKIPPPIIRKALVELCTSGKQGRPRGKNIATEKKEFIRQLACLVKGAILTKEGSREASTYTYTWCKYLPSNPPNKPDFTPSECAFFLRMLLNNAVTKQAMEDFEVKESDLEKFPSHNK